MLVQEQRSFRTLSEHRWSPTENELIRYHIHIHHHAHLDLHPEATPRMCAPVLRIHPQCAFCMPRAFWLFATCLPGVVCSDYATLRVVWPANGILHADCMKQSSGT